MGKHLPQFKDHEIRIFFLHRERQQIRTLNKMKKPLQVKEEKLDNLAQGSLRVGNIDNLHNVDVNGITRELDRKFGGYIHELA